MLYMRRSGGSRHITTPIFLETSPYMRALLWFFDFSRLGSPTTALFITGGGVAQPCVNSHWLSQWEALGTRHFWRPTESTYLNQSLNNLSQVIRSTTSTAVQNLVEIRPWGGFGQIGEILRLFCFYLYPFLSNSPTGQTAHHICTLNGSNDADSRKGVLFGICWYCSPFRRSNCQKKQFWGRE